jgi:hypothetical protein
MRRFGAAVVLLLSGVMPALAGELPPRKPGLWEFRTNNAPTDIQHCIDAATDERLAWNFFSSLMISTQLLTERWCAKRDVQRSGDTITIDCLIIDKIATSRIIIKGSFESAYTVTSTGDMPGGGKLTMTTAAKWLGPCAADQKPGDMIMGGGLKSNILDTQEGLLSGDPLR